MTARAWKTVEKLEVEAIVPLLHRSGPETLRGSGYASRRSSIIKLDCRPISKNSLSHVLFRCRSICGEEERFLNVLIIAVKRQICLLKRTWCVLEIWVESSIEKVTRCYRRKDNHMPLPVR